MVERISRSWRTGEPWEDTFPMRGQDGTYRWFLSRALPIRNELGFVVRWFGTNTDITDQREAEALLERRVAERTAQLAASEQRFRAVFEHAADMVFVVRRTEAGRFVYDSANPALARFLGRRADEIVGRRPDEVIAGPAGTDVEACFAACVARGRAHRCETELAVRGETRTAEWVLVPLVDPARGTVQVVGNARDMTARRELEQRLAKAQNLEAVGQLSGGVAHDFNNLLQVIAGNIDLAQPAIRHGDAERAGRLLDNALRAIGRGARLTGQMLAFSGRQALLAEPVVVGSLVTGMRELIRRAAGEATRLEFRAHPELWTCRIDPVHFESALLNLVLNARDAMPSGGLLRIVLDNARLDATAATAVEGLSPGDYVRVEVADTGDGMNSRRWCTPSNRSSRPRKSGAARGSGSPRCTASPASPAARWRSGARSAAAPASPCISRATPVPRAPHRKARRTARRRRSWSSRTIPTRWTRCRSCSPRPATTWFPPVTDRKRCGCCTPSSRSTSWSPKRRCRAGSAAPNWPDRRG